MRQYFLHQIIFSKIALAEIATNPFRSYCDYDEVTETSNFMQFGSREWNDSENSESSNLSQWRDDRDEWVLEEDDTFKSVPFGHNFGGQYFDQFCISSNGPIYMGDCPTDDDWAPYPISTAAADAWTGVSAFWADFRANEGGNVYYRKVSLEDDSRDSTRDLVIIANKIQTTELIREAHIITFHKMADQNDKNECAQGLSFQYIIVPRPGNDDPYIHFNYGEFGWDSRVITAGWNAYFTLSHHAYNFIEDNPDVASVPDLARRSFTCDGFGCRLTECQERTVYDNVNDRLVCGSDEEEFDLVQANINFVIDLNRECDQETFQENLADLYPEIQTFLDYAYQWADVQDIILDEVQCTVQAQSSTGTNGDLVIRSTIQLRLSAIIQQWIMSGLFEDRELAVTYIQTVVQHQLNIPVSAMQIWAALDDAEAAIEEGIIPDFLSDYIIRDPTTENALIICSWGKVKDPTTDSCVDVNECTRSDIEDLCGAENVINCINSEPGYTCMCENGYTSIPDESHYLYLSIYPSRGPFVCIDIDECMEGTDDCGPAETCQNTEGGFVCVERSSVLLENMNTEDLVADVLMNVHEWGVEHINRNRPYTYAERAAEDVFRHGCICSQLNSNFPQANIVAHDGIDTLCRQFARCQNCIRSNYRQQNASCDSQMFDISYEPDERIYTCGDLGTCQNDHCECNRRFAEGVAHLISQNDSFSHLRVRNRFCSIIPRTREHQCDRESLFMV